jgi:hypothetical protein
VALQAALREAERKAEFHPDPTQVDIRSCTTHAGRDAPELWGLQFAVWKRPALGCDGGHHTGVLGMVLDACIRGGGSVTEN